jgi:hypothetical protein
MKVIALSCREAVLPSQEPVSHLYCEGECQTQRAVPIFAPRFKDCVQGCLCLTRASSNPPACRGIAVTCHKKRSPDGLLAFRFHLPESGRAGEIRTHDLLHPMQAFYQAELQPAIRFGLFGGTAVWRVVKRIQVPDAFFPKHSAGTSWNGVGEGIVFALRWVDLACQWTVLSLSQTPLRSASTVSHIPHLAFTPQFRTNAHPSPLTPAQNQALVNYLPIISRKASCTPDDANHLPPFPS